MERSSDEVPVMGTEQRSPHDLHFLLYYNSNQKVKKNDFR
jgi:hypothetical protein